MANCPASSVIKSLQVAPFGDDILHKGAGCTSELDYTEQSSWLLFLKYLDAFDQGKATQAELAEGSSFRT